MWSGSPRDQVLGGVVAVATMSFLFGMFLMHGIQRLLAHDSTYLDVPAASAVRFRGRPERAPHPQGGPMRRAISPARLAVISLAAVLVLAVAADAATLAPDEAAKHAGENATVCGVVASARYAERSTGQPTFLNLGKPYPDQVFTAVVWGKDRGKFGTPETLRGKEVCVTGGIKLYHGKAEIILSDPKQLSVK
jgi:hypothetical protein